MIDALADTLECGDVNPITIPGICSAIGLWLNGVMARGDLARKFDLTPVAVSYTVQPGEIATLA
jgi:hypothetical protein